MVSYPVFNIIISKWQNWVGGGSNSTDFLLEFHMECIDSKLDKIQGILQTFMLALLFSKNMFISYEKKKILIAEIL